MKRGGPLKRTTGLARRTALKATTALTGGAPLRRTPLAPVSPRKAPRRPGYDYEAFWRSVCLIPSGRNRSVTMARCVICDARCEDAHHVLPKQMLHRVGGRLGMSAEEVVELLMDRRNGIPLCRRCHDLHESAHKRVPVMKLPPKAISFAKWLDSKLGTEECMLHLERTYG